MKIIHCADIHLDSAFTAANPSEAEKRRLSLRSAFSSLILYAKTQGTQLFIISGDLFDSDCVTKDTTIMLCREMGALQDCKFVIAPGNHDPFCMSSPYKLVKWPDNVYIFDSNEISFFEFPELNARVYGYAFTENTYTGRPLDGFHVDESYGGINILAAHCDFGKQKSFYAPVTESELENSGFDCAALGHIHKASALQKFGKTVCCYCGCLEGRSFDETGPKGAVVGQLSNDGVQLKHARFSQKRYEKVQCDITGAKSFSDCAQKIVSECADYGNDAILRLTLTGVTSPEFFADEQLVRDVLPLPYSVEVIDETLAALDIEKLKNDMSVAGEFYRCLESKLMSEDENERRDAYGALKYGLRAINGFEIKA